MQKPKSIDDYLAGVSETQRAALTKLRKTIRSILPDAEECISYSMPAFRYRGDVVGGFLATSKGCSYYPFSGTTLRTLATLVAPYGQTPGALHFEAERGLPVALVRRLLQARIAESQAKHAKAPSTAKPAPRKAKPSAPKPAPRKTKPAPKRSPRKPKPPAPKPAPRKTKPSAPKRASRKVK